MKVYHYVKCSLIINIILLIHKHTNTSLKSENKNKLKTAKKYFKISALIQNPEKKISSREQSSMDYDVNSEKKINEKENETEKHQEHRVEEKGRKDRKIKEENKHSIVTQINQSNDLFTNNDPKKRIYTHENKNISINNYFSNISKVNQSTAGKAFSGFVLGFILLYTSLWLIFRNERASVIETNFIDWIKSLTLINKNSLENQNFNSNTNNTNNIEYEESKAYVTEGIKKNLYYILYLLGNFKHYQNPKIEGLDLSSQNENICIIDINIQEYKILTDINQNGEEKIIKTWEYVSKKNTTHFAGKILLDNVVIDLNCKGLNTNIDFLRKDQFKGDINNLREFMFKKYDYNQLYIQEIREKETQFFYMTNKHFEIKNSHLDNCSNNNFMNGDLKIEIICVNKFNFLN
jgi:hypothetical protein